MKVKKLVILFLLFSALGLIFSTQVSAYNLIGGRFTRGVGNTCYYIDSTASNYTARINAAANNWVYTGHGANPIYMTAVSSSRGTHMDFYGKTTTFFGGDSNVRGETRMFNSSSQDISGQVSYTNWMFAEIYINTSVVATNTMVTQGTCAHEMGHAFGLNHTDDVNTLMYGYSNGRTTHVVTADENNGINAIY